MARPKSRRKGARCVCPACNGEGWVCCATWAEVRVAAGEDLKFSCVGLPLWPLGRGVELNRCPFCGGRFQALGKK